jgi:hypothetical protein
MPCTVLTNIKRKRQLTDLCGPACAQMILLAQGGVVDNSDQVQLELWDEVQEKTGNTANAFPMIEGCGQSDPLEWATHPAALRKTLNAHLPGTPIHVIDHPDEDVSTVNALRSVKQGLGAAVLVDDTTHWIVACGCEHTQPRRSRIPEETIDGDPVTHILVRDPAAGGFRIRQTLEAWRAALYAVECGGFNTKYVVVGARPAR